jgi:hypothetical protein
LEDYFLGLLDDVLAQSEIVPENYGIHEDEWEEEDYPEIEVIRPGTKGKELAIILPRAEWFPKAVRWAQCSQRAHCRHSKSNSLDSQGVDHWNPMRR